MSGVFSKTTLAKVAMYTFFASNFFRKALFISADEIHNIRPDLALVVGERRRCKVRIRYRQPLQDAELIRENEGMYILFDEAQKSITPGQFAAWYIDDELFGSGVIAE